MKRNKKHKKDKQNKRTNKQLDELLALAKEFCENGYQVTLSIRIKAFKIRIKAYLNKIAEKKNSFLKQLLVAALASLIVAVIIELVKFFV